MAHTRSTDLAALFQAALERLSEQQQALNQADVINGDHGDHMVEIFQVALQAARLHAQSDLAEAMEEAGQALLQLPDNGSACLYARGLQHFAGQFRQHGVSLETLLAYGRNLLRPEKENVAHARDNSVHSAEVLKALVAGLSGWSQSVNEQADKTGALNLGALFELGMAYLQAKGRGGSKAEVLADAAASASPLGALPHRYQSGKLAIQSLLQAMADAG